LPLLETSDRGTYSPPAFAKNSTKMRSFLQHEEQVMKREERRRAKANKLKRCLKIAYWLKEQKTPRKYVDNMKKCSCYMCRNIRKVEGPTRQEKLRRLEQD
jgi:hypothetical protein